jgi:hypothetical protein
LSFWQVQTTLSIGSIALASLADTQLILFGGKYFLTNCFNAEACTFLFLRRVGVAGKLSDGLGQAGPS